MRKIYNDLAINLSQTTKMPGHSYSFQAVESCHFGRSYRKMAGHTVCDDCYACNNNYRFENVKKPRRENLLVVTGCMGTLHGEAQWVLAMNEAIRHTNDEWFRFLDSGDVPGANWLGMVNSLAYSLPDVGFYMPTKERDALWMFERNLVNFGIEQAPNLVIRESSPYYNLQVSKYPSNMVATSKEEIVLEDMNVDPWFCPATWGVHRKGDAGNCGSCRACWDEKVKLIVYMKHR